MRRRAFVAGLAVAALVSLNVAAVNAASTRSTLSGSRVSAMDCGTTSWTTSRRPADIERRQTFSLSSSGWRQLMEAHSIGSAWIGWRGGSPPALAITNRPARY